MDADALKYAEVRARELEVAGNNIITGGSTSTLRSRYLAWRDDIERLLSDGMLGLGVSELTRLQSPRHRDLVADAVPAEQLYREATAEVRVALAVLGECLSQARGGLAAPADDDQQVQFTAESGRTYRYRRDAVLGEPGRYGAVFRGHDDHGNAVAVKRVEFRTLDCHRIEDARMAEREVKVGRRLRAERDEHLVPILDVGRLDNAVLLVMPVASESLADRIRRDGPAGSDTTIEIVRQIATGLRQLAALNIVHRDIKPSNVLLLDGRWCISDFGVSRILNAATATLSWVGTGTLEYRAPEIWRGDRELPGSDLYALGCVAYEVLTGSKAFPGPDFREQHMTSLPQMPPDCAPALAALIFDLLAKSPSARPADAREVGQRLVPVIGLTSAQRGLQRIRAAGSARRAADAADDATRAQHVERQAEARQSLNVIWRDVVAQVRVIEPNLETEETDDTATFAIGDTQAKFVIMPTSAHVGELLLLAFVDVSADEQRKHSGACNLLGVWRNDRARWLLCPDADPRIADQTTRDDRPFEYRHLRKSDLEQLWERIASGQVAEGDVVEPATADRILDLIVDGIERNLLTPKVQSRRW